MKAVLMVVEGATEAPSPELGQRTPLEVARCPHAERLAREGRCGWMNPPDRPEGLRPERLFAELCGIPEDEAARVYRGPAEAAALGLDTAGYTHAACGHFVTLDGPQVRDPAVSRLRREETEVLVQALQERFDPAVLRIALAGPARVVVLMRDDDPKAPVVDHPALIERDFDPFSGRMSRTAMFRRVLEESGRVLSPLPLNAVRVDLGENPATHLWLWGRGPILPLSRRAGVVLSNSRMALGLARWIGMAAEPLQDPWSGAADTVNANRALMARALDDHGFCALYLEAPQDPGRYGSLREKVRLLERLDLQVTGPLIELLESHGPARLVLMADATRPLPERPLADRIPVAVWRQGLDLGGAPRWDEASCRKGAMGCLTPIDIHEALKGEA